MNATKVKIIILMEICGQDKVFDQNAVWKGFIIRI